MLHSKMIETMKRTMLLCLTVLLLHSGAASAQFASNIRPIDTTWQTTCSSPVGRVSYQGFSSKSFGSVTMSLYESAAETQPFWSQTTRYIQPHSKGAFTLDMDFSRDWVKLIPSVKFGSQ